jgi:hypothetical protein
MRWAAGRLGLHVDQLNEALSRLLRLGMLTIAGNQWCDRSGLATPDAAKVVDLGLARLRGAMSAS